MGFTSRWRRAVRPLLLAVILLHSRRVNNSAGVHGSLGSSFLAEAASEFDFTLVDMLGQGNGQNGNLPLSPMPPGVLTSNNTAFPHTVVRDKDGTFVGFSKAAGEHYAALVRDFGYFPPIANVFPSNIGETIMKDYNDKSRDRESQHRTLLWPKGQFNFYPGLYEVSASEQLISLASRLIPDEELMLWGSAVVAQTAETRRSWHTDNEVSYCKDKSVTLWVPFGGHQEVYALVLPYSHNVPSWIRSHDEDLKRICIPKCRGDIYDIMTGPLPMMPDTSGVSVKLADANLHAGYQRNLGRGHRRTLRQLNNSQIEEDQTQDETEGGYVVCTHRHDNLERCLEDLHSRASYQEESFARRLQAKKLDRDAFVQMLRRETNSFTESARELSGAEDVVPVTMQANPGEVLAWDGGTWHSIINLNHPETGRESQRRTMLVQIASTKCPLRQYAQSPESRLVASPAVALLPHKPAVCSEEGEPVQMCDKALSDPLPEGDVQLTEAWFRNNLYRYDGLRTIVREEPLGDAAIEAFFQAAHANPYTEVQFIHAESAVEDMEQVSDPGCFTIAEMKLGSSKVLRSIEVDIIKQARFSPPHKMHAHLQDEILLALDGRVASDSSMDEASLPWRWLLTPGDLWMHTRGQAHTITAQDKHAVYLSVRFTGHLPRNDSSGYRVAGGDSLPRNHFMQHGAVVDGADRRTVLSRLAPPSTQGANYMQGKSSLQWTAHGAGEGRVATVTCQYISWAPELDGGYMELGAAAEGDQNLDSLVVPLEGSFCLMRRAIPVDRVGVGGAVFVPAGAAPVEVRRCDDGREPVGHTSFAVITFS